MIYLVDTTGAMRWSDSIRSVTPAHAGIHLLILAAQPAAPGYLLTAV